MLSFFSHITFHSPWAFGLLVFPLAYLIWQVRNWDSRFPAFVLPMRSEPKTRLKAFLRQWLFILKALGMSLLIIALARPQKALTEEEVSSEGIDIVVAIDISSSMLAQDFSPDRLEAAKAKALEFIRARPFDRIGLVVFAGESFTQCPLTSDHVVIEELMADIRQGLIEDGTAIGMGLATAVSRLRDSDAKSRVVILLTDGVNNAGFIDPGTAVEAAMEYGVRVYTIGMGTMGYAKYPVSTPFGTQYQQIKVEIDEALLQDISSRTGGRYFRATNDQNLESIYQEIDRMEKSRIEVTRIRRESEHFHPFLMLGLICLLVDLLLRFSWLRSIP